MGRLKLILLRLWIWILMLVLSMAATLTLLMFGSRWHWTLDLLTNGRPQVCIAALLLAVSFAGLKRWRCWRWSGLIVLIQMLMMWPYVVPHPRFSDDEDDRKPIIKLVTANLFQPHWEHRNYNKAKNLLMEVQPDVVAFQESGGVWREKLKAWTDAFPQQSLLYPHAYHHELSLLASARLPWTKVERVPISQDRWCMGLSVEFELERQTVSVLTVHSYRPTKKQQVSFIREWHAGLAKWVKQKRDAGHAVIVMGDFNCSPWMTIYRDLVKSLGLQEAGKGHPFAATWSPLSPFRMIIDHVFVSEEWRVLSWKTLSDIESDHLPVMVELQWNPTYEQD